MHSSHYAFQNPDATMEASIDGLLNQLTLEEKIDMLSGARPEAGEGGNTVSCPRLGIPSLRMADASVGVHWWIDDTTTYPATIALAASFDTDLARSYATAVARDCRAGGIHILLGPGINLYRSALCGRNFEYFGEDPVLTSRLTVAYVQALQAQGVAATLKHYAVNFQEYDRNKVSSDVDERTLREVYLAAFEAGVKEGGAAAVMTGYNLVNGLHCAEHGFLINQVLKDEWGFEGIVMSDWVSVYDALNSATAGLDLEMPWAVWMNRAHLLPAVRDGRLSERVIDDKIRRLLRLAKSFDWIGREQRLEEPGRNQKNAQVALDVARQSMVLLRNQETLPLKMDKLASLAVIGPNSDPAVICGGGSGYNKGWRTISFLDGIRAEAPATLEVLHARGIDAQIAFDAYQSSAFTTPEGRPGVEAQYFNNNDLSGAPVLTRVEERINNIWKEKEVAPGIGKQSFSIRYRARFTLLKAGLVDFYIHQWDGAVRLLVAGRVVFNTWDREAFGDHDTSILLSAGTHDLVLEFRNIRGWNSCCLGWDETGRKRSEYQKALDLAARAEMVVYCGGFNHRNEAEGADRSFAMPGTVENLLLEVMDRNPRVVVVLTAGGNLDMGPWHDRAAAIVHTWYPGQEGGTALAEILSGRVNPSGRLPATFEKSLADRSSFHSYHDSDGDLRVELTDGVFGGYRHFDRSGIVPRYPFGFGLSYTTFGYEKLTLSKSVLGAGESLSVTFFLKNTGPMRGGEVAQLYVAPIGSRAARAPKELKNFRKCFLDPGETQTVTLPLGARDFSWFNVDQGAWEVEPGTYEILIAANADDIRLRARLELQSIACSSSSN